MKIAIGIAAVLVGAILGGVVNMGIIMYGSTLIPAPEGVDVTNAESIAAGMHLFEPKHFVTPFLAHAIGTLVGAVAAALIAPAKRLWFGIGIGGFFLLGGVVNAFMIPAPAWCVGVDLVLAYLPMGWLGATIAMKIRGEA